MNPSTGDGESFGILLRRLRLAASLSQEDLAERCGLSAKGIAVLERGQRRAPRPSTVALLATGLGLAAADLEAFIAAANRDREGPEGPALPAARPTPSLAPPASSCSNLFPAPEVLVGREAELGRLRQLLADTGSGGRTALVGGAAGSGKSALVGAVVRAAEAREFLCLAGAAYEHTGVLPLGAFREALVAYILQTPRQQARALLGSAAAALAVFAPELRYYLDLGDAPAGGSLTQPDLLFAAVQAFLRTLAERGPVVLCIEDLHAADEATARLFIYLANHIARTGSTLRLLLIGTYRAEDLGRNPPLARWLQAAAGPRLDHVGLAPLDRDATARLAEGVLGGPASAALLDWLQDTAAGNPLFIEQLLLAARTDQRLDQRAGVWRLRDRQQPSVPTRIRQVIRTRLEHLGQAARDVVAMAAVVGHTVDHEVLQACLDQADADTLVTGLEEALQAQLLREVSGGSDGGGGGGYAFSHALVREVTYLDLSGPRRMLLHERVGSTLERLADGRASEQAAPLAYHFARAGTAERVRLKALQYSLEAGRHAAAVGSHRDAQDHFARAFDLACRIPSTDAAVRLEALEGRGLAERYLGLWSDCVTSFRQVLTLTDDHARRARARESIATAVHHTDGADGMLAEIGAGLSELDDAPETAEAVAARLQLEYVKALLLFMRGHYTAIQQLGEGMIERAAESGSAHALFRAHSVTGWGWMGLGQAERALEEYRQALASAQDVGRLQVAIAHENIGMQLLRSGALEEAAPHVELAIKIFTETAGEQRAVNSLQLLACVRFAQGRLDEAGELGQVACELATHSGDRWAGQCHELLGAVHASRANWTAAEQAFEAAIAIHERAGHLLGRVEALLGLGLVHERRGDWQRAHELYANAMALADTGDPSPQCVAARLQLGMLLRRKSDPEGERHLHAAQALAERMPRTTEHAAVLLARSALTASAGQGALAIQQARLALESTSVVWLRAEARLRLARLAAEAGEVVEARAHAACGLELAESFGDPRLLGLARLEAARLAAEHDRVAALGHIDAALGHFRAAHLPYERGLALVAKAQLLDTSPRPAEQDDTRRCRLLHVARGLFRRLGAEPDAARAEATLRGIRPVGVR